MGTITNTTIINKVATILFDANNVKWSRVELLGWVNDGCRAVVSMIPEANSVVSSVKMVAGTRQTLPANAWLLLEITRNMGASGNSAGRALKRVDRAILDETNPTWYADAATASATLYMYNTRDRAGYYVYPASDGTGYLEVIASIMPTDTAEAAAISILDVYEPALIDYVLWRSLSKGAPFADQGKADNYFKSYSMYILANTSDAARISDMMGNIKTNTPQSQGSVNS